MLEGLEVREANFFKAITNKDFRIDSQFYTKEPKQNHLLHYDKIGNLLKNAQYGISIAMNEEGAGCPIYRMNEIHSMMCDLEVDKCADITLDEIKTFKLNNRDVLFNRTNSFEWVGRTGLYNKIDSRDFVFASYLVRFIPNQEKLLPEYLVAFLNSKQGMWDVKRRARQSINQTNVNPEEVKEIYIPLLSMETQKLIKNCFDIAHKTRVQAQETYLQAKENLLVEVGLNDFVPSSNSVNIKKFSDSFATSGRLDAEYYQRKYDDLYEAISKTSSKSISEIRVDNFRGLQPVYAEDGTLAVINSKHILEDCLDYENFEKANADFWEIQQKARVFNGDILIYTTGANIGRTQVYLSNKKALASNHVNILRLKEGYNPLYVGFVMNSFVGRMQTEKLSAGSAQAELYPKNIDEFVIPIIAKPKQQKIASLLEESFALKKQSEHLLDVAKRAVEIAIEQDEAAALKYIKENS